MRLGLVKDAFDDPQFLFELKHDGFRALAYIEDRECRLIAIHPQQIESVKHGLRIPFQEFVELADAVLIDTDNLPI